MEGFSEHLFVVHRIEDDIARVLLSFGFPTVNLGGSRHVETFFTANVVRVVDALKRRIVFAVDVVAACRTVRFVADDETEVGHSELLLRFVEDVDRMVGGKNDRDGVVVVKGAGYALGERFRVRSGGIGEFASDRQMFDVFEVDLPRRRVGTDGKGVDTERALLLPVGERLRKKRERGDEKQYKPTAITLGWG